MKTAIVLYTILAFQGGPDKGTITTVAWNLPFPTYEICELFWEREQENLLNGALQYAQATYKQPTRIKEQGCIKATESEIEGDWPTLSDQKPLYIAGKDI